MSTVARASEPWNGPLRGRIDKRHAIMTAARTVFLRDGYAGATIESVAAEAGVSKQTIYNHLRDKEMLFVAVVEDTLQQSSSAALAVVAAFPERPAEFERELVGVGWQMIKSFMDEDAIAIRRLLHAEERRHPSLLTVWRAWGPIRFVEALSDRFARLARSGYLELDDPDRAARQFFSLVTFDPFLQSSLGSTPVTDAELEKTIHAAIEMFLRRYAPR
ncbi:TetR/AcrR family transcriptional regulator [Pseudonocardia spinosispora]|uniref:TetR/AcrR family transcriptional regulator n=1 Tax=Pseudonocardia spinosispora TaxID=103441 RepID=UPI00041C70A6|nr:TetR/AcrR family transcriptional regulator [Pseudonocardia spinosispora]